MRIGIWPRHDANQPYMCFKAITAETQLGTKIDIIGTTDFGTSTAHLAFVSSSGYNSANGRITVPVAGVYMVHLDAPTIMEWEAVLRVLVGNGKQFYGSCHLQVPMATLHVTQLVPMAANDYIRFHHGSGSDRAFYEGINHTYAFIMKTA